MFSNSRTRALKLAGVGAVAAGAIVAAPAALAVPTHAAPASAVAAKKLSPPFTLGLSSYKVKPGQALTASGLAYARAGLPLTLVSKAISSAKFVNGLPAVTTPALVEGIYKTTIHIPPAIKDGTYTIKLLFKGKQVSSINNLRVVSPSSKHGGGTTTGCAGIGFTVLHNDHAGVAFLPKGPYTVSSRTMACDVASEKFTAFLAAAGKPLAGWKSSTTGSGHAVFTQTSNGHGFTVAKK
jgi:hypothetical protein